MLSKFFVSCFMGGEGHRLHPRGRHRGLNPGPHLPLYIMTHSFIGLCLPSITWPRAHYHIIGQHDNPRSLTYFVEVKEHMHLGGMDELGLKPRTSALRVSSFTTMPTPPRSPIPLRSPICRVGRPPFISRFMGGEGHRMHPRGRHRGLNPGPHLPFTELGDHPSSPVSWARRVVVCTQGEAPQIEPNTSTPISQAGRPLFISRFMGWEGHCMHPRRGTGD